MAVATMVKAQKTTTTTRKTSKPLIAAYLTCDIDGVMPSYTGVSLGHIGLFSSSFADFPVSTSFLLHFVLFFFLYTFIRYTHSVVVVDLI